MPLIEALLAAQQQADRAAADQGLSVHELSELLLSGQAAPSAELFAKSLAHIAQLPGHNPIDLHPLWGGVIHSEKPKLLDALIEAGAPIDPPDRSSPLALAIQRGSLAACDALLHAGANPNAFSNTRKSKEPLLLLAMRSQRPDLAASLLRHGCNPHGSAPRNITYLHLAVNYNDEASVAALLALGADPLAEADGGLTPLLLAEQANYPGCAHLLRSFIEAKALAAHISDQPSPPSQARLSL